MKILLACAAGMSTSILMKKLEKYAAEQGIEPFEIAAVSVSAAKERAEEGDFECCLVGPQVGYQVDKVAEATGLPTKVIPTEVYGNADCLAVIGLARELIASAPRVTEPAATAQDLIGGEGEPLHDISDTVHEETPAPEAKPQSLLEKFAAFGTSMQQNKVVSSISGGMMGTMGLILAGAVFTIIATLGDMLGFIPQGSALYNWLQLPYNMCMNAMTLPIAFGVAYGYTKALGKKGEVANGFVSMILFLIVAAPFQTVELADGSTMTVIDTTFLGGTGIFTALILPILVVKIIALCEDKHITIKMPDVVPPFLADSFNTLIPLIINIVLFHGLNTLCKTFMGAALPAIIMGIIGIPLGALVSGPGMVVLCLLCCLFWCLGIHGTAIVYMVIMPVMMQMYGQNAALVAAGQAPEFNPVFLFGAVATCGGTGNILPLAVHCLRAKSEKLKAVGKASVIPAVFNISEPMVFGLPIMYNPVIDIPFILNVGIMCVLVWAGYAIGFLVPPSVMIMTALPVGMGEFLSCMSWHNVMVPVAAFIVGYLVYLPFVKRYDAMCLAEEAERAEQAQTAA